MSNVKLRAKGDVKDSAFYSPHSFKTKGNKQEMTGLTVTLHETSEHFF